jgi:glycosyltransferase involved in cell wall biosynthesis
MIDGRRIVVVFPAYNAEKTLAQTLADIPRQYVDEMILVDDGSHDKTVELAHRLGIRTFVHEMNLGYGANQKTCYREALRLGADIVVMVHPDYQYSPKLVPAMASLVASGHYDIALGSRILGNDALKGGMPLYKYVANRFLTLAQNLLCGAKLSEYHTGFRAFSANVLRSLPLEENSDDFIFDNQMLAQALWQGFVIGEVSCPTRYMEEASSINFRRSMVYGIGVLGVSLAFALTRLGVVSPRFLSRDGRRLKA